MVFEFLYTMPISTFFIMLAGMGMSLVSAFVQRRFTDTTMMSEFKAKNSELRKRISEARKSGDRKAYAKLMKQQKELMRESTGMMGQQYKVMAIPMIAFLLIYYALNHFYSPGGVPVVVAYAPFPIPWGTVGADHMDISFYLWYTLCAFTFNMAIYRIFKIGV